MNKEQKTKTLKILDIVSFIGVFVFFIFALICAIFRFTGAKFTLFGNRYDVVLTDSMSEKNEKYKEFLNGHDDQFKAFDLAKSKKVESPSDLHQYDVVIYNDRSIGTNMHRIVNVIEESCETTTFSGSSIKTIGGHEGFSLDEVGSDFSTSEIQFKTLVVEVYSQFEQYDHFNFNIMGTFYTPTVSSAHDENGYIHTYTIVNNNENVPGQITITHNSIYDYSKEIFTSVKIDSKAGDISVSSSNLNEKNSKEFTNNFNCSYAYEIRGDKSSTSDGLYRFNEIEAKVVKNISGMGYLIRFLGSLWGGIMFILLGVLFLVFDILMNYFPMSLRNWQVFQRAGKRTLTVP